MKHEKIIKRSVVNGQIKNGIFAHPIIARNGLLGHFPLVRENEQITNNSSSKVFSTPLIFPKKLGLNHLSGVFKLFCFFLLFSGLLFVIEKVYVCVMQKSENANVNASFKLFNQLKNKFDVKSIIPGEK